MTKDVIVVEPSMKMSELGEVFLKHRISDIPVMDKEKIVGFITIRNYIKWIVNKEKDCHISEKMSRKVKIVFEDSFLVEALKKIKTYQINCFPVIDDNLNLVGVITRGDIIKCIFRKMETDYPEDELQTYRASHFFEDILADKAKVKLHYTIKGKDFKHAGDCASNLKKTSKRLGFNTQVIRKIAIAVYEAELNIIVYADEGEILAEIDQDKVIITVKDKGPGIEDIEKAMQPGYSTAPDWVRDMGFGAGMGLYNIKRCSDEMKITSDVGIGTYIDIIISLTPDKD